MTTEILIGKIKKTFEENGISENEYMKRYEHEKGLNNKIDIDLEQKEKRAWVAVLNYFRRYIERSANKVKFLCLGVTRPTTYSLSGIVRNRKQKFKRARFEEDHTTMESMISKGEVDIDGNVLFTAEDTFKEEQIGKKINLEDALSQMLIGVVEDENGKRLPAMVRVYGGKACGEKKYMYKWTKLFGRQGTSKKYPTYYILDTNEVNMKVIDDKRISYNDYKTTLREYFMDKVINMNNLKEGDFKRHEGKHVFLVNSCISDMNFDNNRISFYVSSMDKKYEMDNILATSTVGTQIDIDVDPLDDHDLILNAIVMPKKEQDDRYRVETIGIFSENTIEPTNNIAFHSNSSNPFEEKKQDNPIDKFLKGETTEDKKDETGKGFSAL